MKALDPGKTRSAGLLSNNASRQIMSLSAMLNEDKTVESNQQLLAVSAK